jgi:hypothetical protein
MSDQKHLFEIIRDSEDLYGSLWPQKIGRMLVLIALEIPTSGEDEYGVYENTARDTQLWLLDEAKKAEQFWGYSPKPPTD